MVRVLYARRSRRKSAKKIPWNRVCDHIKRTALPVPSKCPQSKYNSKIIYHLWAKKSRKMGLNGPVNNSINILKIGQNRWHT